MTPVQDRWTMRPFTSAGKDPNVFLTVIPSREYSSSCVHIFLLNLHSDSATTVSPQNAERTEGTSSGPHTIPPVPIGQSSSEAIMELRRRSGLTWEQLSELFSVSPRSVHYWANGRLPTSRHESDIRNTLDAIQRLDNGIQRDTRSRLLSTDYGESIFNLLVARKYEDVLRLATETTTAVAAHDQISISKDERERRRPTRPELLLGALQDRPKISPNKARTVRPMRRNRPRE